MGRLDMRRHWWLGTLLLIGVGAAPLPAQSPAPQPGCPASEHRQFEFWVGNWNVTVQGHQAGTNEVTLEESGCVIHEHWIGAGGGTGQSFNFYDRAIGQWHQFWVDNQGNYLHLTGRYGDGRLVLTGTAPGPNGAPAMQRLTFFNNPDGTVRQLWESSNDEGKTWQVAFDGLYRKR
jgi:hypothetical protein